MNKHLLHHINQTLQAAPNLNKTIFVSSERNHSAQCWSSCVRLQNRDVHVYLAWNTTCSTKQIPMITTCFPRKQTVSSRTSRMQRSGTAAYRISSWLPSCQGHLGSLPSFAIAILKLQLRQQWQSVLTLLNHVWSPDVCSESYLGILEHLQWKKKLKNCYML